ncbi:Polyketide cyclase / dehydrase and lipid transport [Paucimonas lemoignei]|jgi:hypothetical protein|nr:Polyketide cyclase / dehydrase and lipid transport [Paucimonas lemoignei]
MATVEYNELIDNPADQAWKVLRQFGGIAQWHPGITRSQIEGELADDTVGAIRRLELADGGIIRERLLSLSDSGRTLSYTFEQSPLPLDNYQAQVKVVQTATASQCAVHWSATFDVRDPGADAHYETLITGLIVDGHLGLVRMLQQ